MLKVVRNRIKWPQRLKIIERVRKERDGFEQRRLTKAEAAAEMSTMLGFEVPEAVLRDVIKTLGIDWKVPQVRTARKVKSKPTWSTRVIARSIVEMAREMGMSLKYASELAEIAVEPPAKEPQAAKE